MFKRIYILLICFLLIATSSFSCFVFADDTLDGWRNATTNEEFAEAFRYYCKSRDLTLDGTVANVLTNGTTNIFNALCRGAGIDMAALQGHIKYEVDSSGNKGVKWLLDSTGISFYNRLFAQFLQDNDLEVGDSVNKLLYSGYSVSDWNGNSVLVYVTSQNLNSTTSILSNYMTYKGSPYLFSGEQVKTYMDSVGGSPVFFDTYFKKKGTETYYDGVFSKGYKSSISTYCYNCTSSNDDATILYGLKAYAYNDVRDEVTFEGDLCVVNSSYNNKFYLATYTHNLINDSYEGYKLHEIDVYNPEQGNLSIVSVQINNNIYEGDTIINNDGDVINEPSPGGKDPGWDIGGGQGSYDDGQGNNYTINFPDFELPDLNIDWSIQGLGNKFPFSIPFDIASLITVLNAEPEAPRFQGTVNFGFTTWDYDINLQQFDTVAQVCRIAELLLLVFGLILITRSIIKG